jgi:hypothetical protein
VKALASTFAPYFGAVSLIVVAAICLLSCLVTYALRLGNSVKTSFSCKHFGFSLETRKEHVRRRRAKYIENRSPPLRGADRLP